MHSHFEGILVVRMKALAVVTFAGLKGPRGIWNLSGIIGTEGIKRRLG